MTTPRRKALKRAREEELDIIALLEAQRTRPPPVPLETIIERYQRVPDDIQALLDEPSALLPDLSPPLPTLPAAPAPVPLQPLSAIDDDAATVPQALLPFVWHRYRPPRLTLRHADEPRPKHLHFYVQRFAVPTFFPVVNAEEPIMLAVDDCDDQLLARCLGVLGLDPATASTFQLYVADAEGQHFVALCPPLMFLTLGTHARRFGPALDIVFLVLVSSADDAGFVLRNGALYAEDAKPVVAWRRPEVDSERHDLPLVVWDGAEVHTQRVRISASMSVEDLLWLSPAMPSVPLTGPGAGRRQYKDPRAMRHRLEWEHEGGDRPLHVVAPSLAVATRLPVVFSPPAPHPMDGEDDSEVDTAGWLACAAVALDPMCERHFASPAELDTHLNVAHMPGCRTSGCPARPRIDVTSCPHCHVRLRTDKEIMATLLAQAAEDSLVIDLT